MSASFGMIFSVPGPLTVNQHHWFAPAVPFVFAGSISGALGLSGWISKDDDSKKKIAFRILGLMAIGASLLFTFFGGLVGKYHNDKKDDLTFLELKSVFDSRIYTMTETDKIAWRMIEKIPADATVTTNYGLMTPLATRENIKEFGRDAPRYNYFDFDYILIHLKDQYFGAGHDVRLFPGDLQGIIDSILSRGLEPIYCDKELFFGREGENFGPMNQTELQNTMDNLFEAKALSKARLKEQGVMNIRE